MITSHGNPLLKSIRLLRQPKGRRASRLFLVEGIHHIGEAVQAGWQIAVLVYAPDLLTSDFALRLVEEQSKKGVRVAALSPDLFTDLAGKDNPQGLLALVHQRTQRLDDTRVERLAVALVSPQDPGNVGTVLRTLDAVGGQGVFLLDGGVDPFHPSSVRASMGTVFWQPLVQAGFGEFALWAKKQGYRLIGSSAHAASDYRIVNVTGKPCILVLGSEQKGLTQEQTTACDVVVSLPMSGRASSLNLAVAAGVLLYQLMK